MCGFQAVWSHQITKRSFFPEDPNTPAWILHFKMTDNNQIALKNTLWIILEQILCFEYKYGKSVLGCVETHKECCL